MSEPLLVIKNLVIEGFQEEQWNEIVQGVSLSINRGEVLGLIGESGAGKSTIGIAAMGYARPGCRIVSGSINFDDVDMVKASEDQLKKMRGVRVAYVAQSAAASFNPAHRIVQQFTETPVVHKVMGFSQAEQKSKDLFKSLDLPDPDNIGRRFPTRFPVVSCSVPWSPWPCRAILT